MNLSVPFCATGYAMGFAPRDGPLAYPSFHQGLMGLWAPYLGPSGTELRNWSPYGESLNGTLINMSLATDWVITPSGWALNFDKANSDYVLIGQKAPLQIVGHFAISVRVKVTVAPTTTVGVVSQLHGNGTGYWGIWIRSDDKIEVNYNQVGVGFTTASYTVGLTEGQTYNVVGQWDGVDLKIFIDGIERNSTAATGGVLGAARDLVFGRTSNLNFWGDLEIEHVGIWNRSLSPDEIQHIHVDHHVLTRLESDI